MAPWTLDDEKPRGQSPPRLPAGGGGDVGIASGPALMAVTNAVVAACKQHTGRGPTRAKAHLYPNALHIVLGDWMTREERTLTAGGRQDLIA
jgi:hypothetical protein